MIVRASFGKQQTRKTKKTVLPTPIPPRNSPFSAIAASAALTVLVALALSLAFRVGRGADLLAGARRAAERYGLLGQTQAESGTDLDGDTFASLASGGTDCYDSLQAQYSDFPNSSNACDSTDNARVINLTTNIADHSWIKDSNGTWHLFFQDAVAGNHRIEHHTTTDFTNFTFVGYALAPTSGKFDSYGIWAPNVVKNPTDGLYYMFYAGVTGAGSNPNADQRIGVATSSDLTTWTKVADPGTCSAPGGDGCVYECNNAWTTWGDNGQYDEQCRDPFVIWDSANSRWVMFTTVRFDATATGCVLTGQGINVATSTNLTSWTSQGYIKATCLYSGGTGAQTTGGISENPFVTAYDSTYYLWFNDYNDTEDAAGTPNARTQQQYATATTLTADASGSTNWTYRGYTPNPGVNATEIIQPQPDVWIMSQSMANGNIGSQWSNRDLIWHRVVWGDNFTLTGSKLSNLSCRVASNTIKPGGTEICSDNVDQNCSGAADEALYCAACTDSDGDGYGVSGLNNCLKTGVDPNDADAAIYPGAAEACDAKDNDSDGQIDEGNVCPCVEAWGCGNWSACSAGEETRICADGNVCGTTTSKPAVTRSCDVPAPAPGSAACTEDWSCGAWSSCVNGFQTRSCSDANACSTAAHEPASLKSCVTPESALTVLPVSRRGVISLYGPSGNRVRELRPFPTATGTHSLALGDVDGNGETDLVAGSGRGGPPRVRVFDRQGRKWGEFAPFNEAVRTGVTVVVGDVDGNAQRDIVAVTGPDAVGRIRTLTYDLDQGAFVRRASFTPVDRWRGGWHVLLDDLDGDARADLILVPRGQRQPLVRIYRFDASRSRWVLGRKFRVSASGRAPSFATGDVDGNGEREFLVAPGVGSAPTVGVYSRTGRLVRRLTLGAARDRRGRRLSTVDTDLNGTDELYVLDASGRNRTVRSYERNANGRYEVRQTFSINITADGVATIGGPR